jgi:hypothetical protein
MYPQTDRMIDLFSFSKYYRMSTRPLRSRKSIGVIQELYGLLIAHYAIRF